MISGGTATICIRAVAALTLFNTAGGRAQRAESSGTDAVISDNSADRHRTASRGGPEAVTAKMRELGVTGIRVDVDRESDRGLAGAKLRRRAIGRHCVRNGAGTVTPEEQNAANNRFDQDSARYRRARAMTDLLVQIYNKKLHKPSGGAAAGHHAPCQSGEARVRGILPRDTTVAHKTGSIGGSINDVGY